MYRPIGRTRIKLAAMLTKALGFEIKPEDFWLQDPTHLRVTWDCAAWGADVKAPDADVIVHTICSFDSMTECVRNGFTFIYEKGINAYADYEIVAKPRKTK